MYYIILKLNDAWYKSFAGIYADDLIAFIGLLEYMNQYDCIEDMKKQDEKMQSEYFNTCVCQRLDNHFRNIAGEVSLDQILGDEEDTF